MTNLAAELEVFNKARKAELEANKVKDASFPKIKRTYTYRNSPKINAHDIASL